MKILFVSMVSLENNTSATIRNKGLLKGLVQLGHSVDVITLKPNENNISYDKTINDDINGLVTNNYYIDIDPVYALVMAKKGNTNIKESKTENIVIKNLKKVLKNCRNLIKRIYDNIAIFDAQKINVKRFLKFPLDYNKYDIIISSSDPKSSHLIVKEIYKKNKSCKSKWIQYWGDPMLNDITRKNDWRDILVKYYETKLISMADRIVYVSPLTLKIQKETFSKYAFKMDYSNQACIDISTGMVSNSVKKNDSVIIGYFGAYYSKVRNILPLYNSAKDEDFILNICGASDILLQDTSNISVNGILTYKETIKLEMASDILVCICNIGGTQIPGKIYYSARYMKPIIIILDGEHTEYLRKYFSGFNRYILCENEESSIKNAIKIARKQILNKDFIIPEQLKPKFIAKKLLWEFEK